MWYGGKCLDQPPPVQLRLTEPEVKGQDTKGSAMKRSLQIRFTCQEKEFKCLMFLAMMVVCMPTFEGYIVIVSECIVFELSHNQLCDHTTTLRCHMNACLFLRWEYFPFLPSIRYDLNAALTCSSKHSLTGPLVSKQINTLYEMIRIKNTFYCSGHYLNNLFTLSPWDPLVTCVVSEEGEDGRTSSLDCFPNFCMRPAGNCIPEWQTTFSEK